MSDASEPAAPAAGTPPPGSDVPFDLDANDESLPTLRALFRDHGDIAHQRTRTRAKDSIALAHPDDIRQVLLVNRANYVKGVGLERIRVLIGNGLIVSDGDFWARQRRMIQPAFHSRVMRQFSDRMRFHNLALLEHWNDCARTGTPINLTREMSEVTLSIVLAALFGPDLDRFAQENGGVNPFAVIAQESNRDLAFAAKFRALAKLVRQTIERRRQEQRVEADFLSMLMEARDKESGEPMPDRALLDEVMGLIVAGHETTASTLNWAWYELSQHPEEEARLHAAIAGAPAPEAITVEQAIQYPLVDHVLDECLRRYPPVWLFGRRAIADDRLGGFHVPAGTDLFISPYLLHHDPRFWPEPHVFRPDRFDEATSAQRHRFAFLPFSAGPRHCVGEGFAMAEMAMHLIMAAQRFRLEYGSAPPELEFQINLRTREDLQMRIVAR